MKRGLSKAQGDFLTHTASTFKGLQDIPLVKHQAMGKKPATLVPVSLSACTNHVYI